jgi:prophage antirepressor-like protein
VTELAIFTYLDGFDVRTTTDDSGEPWFFAADVCAVLGIANVSDAVSRLDGADVGSTEVWSPSNNRSYGVKTINESGLYDLVMDSRKAEAKKFRRWVTSDVLPTIRRDGGYISPTASQIQLARIQEKIDYAEVRDLMAGAVDYDSTDKWTRVAFGQMQNQFHVAITGLTAKELLAERTQLRGDTYKRGELVGQLKPSDTAKDYLTDVELRTMALLGKIVAGRLGMIAVRGKAYTMSDFRTLVAEEIQRYKEL